MNPSDLPQFTGAGHSTARAEKFPTVGQIICAVFKLKAGHAQTARPERFQGRISSACREATQFLQNRRPRS
jgi:hypothetical protein